MLKEWHAPQIPSHRLPPLLMLATQHGDSIPITHTLPPGPQTDAVSVTRQVFEATVAGCFTATMHHVRAHMGATTSEVS